MAKFAAKDSNKNIILSPHGTGKIVVGTGAADAIVESDGNHNLKIQTGNSTTGFIEITDGANGNIDLTPNGTGEVNISKVDIDAGTIDGCTLGSTNTGYGLIPLGTIIPIASGITNAYTIPSTGTVDSNGYVLCDGASFHGDCTLSGNAPSLTDGRFLRGNTHANVGATGGADTYTLAEANIPQHNHTQPTHTHTGPSHSHTGPSHSHSWSTSGGYHTHSIPYGHTSNPSNSRLGSSTNVQSNMGTNSTSHSHSGNTGNAGSGSTGSAGTGATGASGGDDTGNWGTASPTAVDTVPKYLQVVYLIRAK